MTLRHPQHPRTATRTLLAGAAIALLLGMAAVPASAHAAPSPAAYETRLLHDYNDDWGGHAVARDGHDLIALDVVETYDPTLGNLIGFKLTMNGGYSQISNGDVELREMLTFTLDGASQSLELKTTDNSAFTGDYDLIVGPEQVYTDDGAADGARFSMTGFVKLTSVGAQVGDEISGYQVRGFAGTSSADDMGVAAPENDPLGAAFTRASYTIAGPTQFATMTADTEAITTTTGTNESIALTIKNKLNDAQNVTVSASLPDGLDASLHKETYSQDPITFALAGDEETIVHVFMVAQAATEGTITVSYTTSLGGHESITVPFTATAAPADDDHDGADGASDAANATHDAMDGNMTDAMDGVDPGDAHEQGDDQAHVETTEESGALGAVAVALGAIAMVGLARRQRQ